MKKFMIVSVITILPIATGCCGAWPRLPMYRGDMCDTCAATGVPTGFEMGPVYEGGILPAPTAPANMAPALPGPAPAS